MELQYEVLTLEEVSSFLRVSKESLESEIDSGRFPSFRVGGELRILKRDLLEFVELAKTLQPTSEAVPTSAKSTWFDLRLTPADSFSYKWPSGDKEHYQQAYTGVVHVGNGTKAIQVGLGERKSAGKLRQRVVVFIDKRPVVEFVGSDDFQNTGIMVSLLKHKNGKQVRPAERIPAEYNHLKIEPYDKYVTGPYASSNLALVCSPNDLSIMAEHALLRLKKSGSKK